MPPEHQHLIQIRDLIHRYFNLEEFRTLCFDLGISYDDLGGEGLKVRIQELVALCDRTGRLDHLLAFCGQYRPHAHWPERNNPAGRLIMPATLMPPVQNPRQIFVSHAHQDAAFAQRLAADLRRAGWDIWIAPQSIRPGEQWVTAVNRGLEESGVFVLVLTPDAAQSSWVRRETDAAIHLEHQEKIRFISLDVKPTSQPPLWQTYQWVSFQGIYQRGLQQLLGALRVEAIRPEMNRAEVASTPVLSLKRVIQREQERTPKALTSVAPKAGETRIWPKDGKIMVYVPAGEFLYGVGKQRLDLDGFWIDKTPVTCAEYKRFLDANSEYKVPEDWNEQRRTYPVGKKNHPVVYVSWDDAKAYAEWVGKRLPAEQEWEKAARGVDGRICPWGKWQSGCANTIGAKINGTSPVGQFSPQGDSPYGCVDMMGNVWEWTDSWMSGEKGRRVIRGGSWDFDYLLFLEDTSVVACISSAPNHSYNDVGFRLIVPRILNLGVIGLEI